MKLPFFELSKSLAISQYNFATKLADIVSYSSKTNPDVTPILENETDAQFNIHTIHELVRVKDKTRVFFLAQALSFDQLDDLFCKDVSRIIVDNETDLNTLLDYLKSHDVKIELFLRTKLKENSIKTERYFVFGMSTNFVNEKVLELKKNKKITRIGIHFHRKTQNMAEWNYKYEIEQMFTPECLNAIDVIDIGGGLPSIYANTNIKVFDSIYKTVKELKVWLNKKKIKLMIEPGRFICAPSVKLVTHIIAIYENNIIVDASVYNSDTDAFTVPTKLLVVGELDKYDNKAEPYVIKGCTPCSMDLFRYRVYLKNPKLGQKIVFDNAGAYNFACDFCDLEKIETKIVK